MGTLGPDDPTPPDGTVWAGSTAPFLQKLAAWCMEQVGKPVLWAAKGDWYESPDGVKTPFPRGVVAFDCSGLINCGVLACGGPDRRDTHNAQALWNEAPPAELTAPPSVGALGFYGADAQHVNHVVLALAGGHLVSADGATHAIRDLSAAIQARAQVRVHQGFAYRRDEPFLGWRPSDFLFPVP